MTPDDFFFIARLLKERSGLVLTKDKGYLVENRLVAVLREHGLADFEALVARLRAGESAITTAAVDAMLSKDTGFFRDWKPFKHLAKVVFPNLCAARRGRKAFRILCAGVATGQEAYSTAMQIREAASTFEGWRVEIVGIDISAAAIAFAERGIYNQFDVQRGLPIRRLLRYFDKLEGGWRLHDEVRGLVSFRTWNLLDELYPLGRFDVILCRNVLFYFDQQTKLTVLQKLARLLADDGVLYVGINESVTGVSGSFRPIAAELGIYAADRGTPVEARSIGFARAEVPGQV